MKLSLVMATYNRTEQVEKSINCLVNQNCRNFELIIVDQNLDDRLMPYIKKARENGVSVNRIRQSIPDQSMARNTGAKAAKYDLISFPDDDCWYDFDTISSVITAFKKHELDVLISQWSEKDRGLIESHEITWNNTKTFKEATGCSMSNQFYRKHVFFDIGGFDHNFGLTRYLGAAEDTDLFFSAISHPLKFKARYDKDVVVHHNFVAKTRGSIKDLRSRSRGTGALYVKHEIGIASALKGIISPILKPLLKLDIKESIRGFCMSIGRIEGAFYYMKHNIGEDNCREMDFLRGK